MSPRKDTSMTDEEIAAFLAVPRTAVFTTIGPDGWPHSSGMWFVPGDGEILMWTYAKSQKAMNARRDQRCSFLVEDGTGYDELRGVLVRGPARVTDELSAVVSVGRALYERYTFPQTGIPYEAGPVVEVERQAVKRVALVVPMERVASWDHRKV